MDNNIINAPLLIFMADDDKDDQEIFAEAIDSISTTIKMRFFDDGQELRDYLAIADDKPDYFFLDINMPKCNGLSCLRIIRQDPKFDGSRIIIYSTSISPTDVAEARSLKADLYLQKPSSLSDLKSALIEIFKINFPSSAFEYKYQ
jgi:CheY-like chemotaxis protein